MQPEFVDGRKVSNKLHNETHCVSLSKRIMEPVLTGIIHNEMSRDYRSVCLIYTGRIHNRNHSVFGLNELYHGEYDPGSERTLAARLKHASRAARFSNGP